MSQSELFETPRHHLHRRDAPQTSVDAAHSIDVTKLEEFVLKQVELAGKNGTTAKQIVADFPDMPYSSLTARPKTLEQRDLIYYEGDRRDGARVMRLKKYDKGFRVCPKCLGVLLKFYNMECKSPRCK